MELARVVDTVKLYMETNLADLQPFFGETGVAKTNILCGFAACSFTALVFPLFSHSTINKCHER